MPSFLAAGGLVVNSPRTPGPNALGIGGGEGGGALGLREVLGEVVLGRVNKQIAYDLNISIVTVKLRRGIVMRKMAASSIDELIRAWGTLPARLREARRPGR